MKQIRLDEFLVLRDLVSDIDQARRIIMAGEVSVPGMGFVTSETRVPLDADIQLAALRQYVSRGGIKLAGAMDLLGICVEGRIAADVGASTGGFTDCLLQHGAARVYAIDVGYGQLAWSVRSDPRVVVMDRTNARYLENLPEPVDLVVIDASFISLKALFPPITGWFADEGGDLVALIKPQFEAEREFSEDGVIRDSDTHRRVLESVISWAVESGWHYNGLCRSPITGPKGNVEFFVWLRWNRPALGDWQQDIQEIVAGAGGSRV